MSEFTYLKPSGLYNSLIVCCTSLPAVIRVAFNDLIVDKTSSYINQVPQQLTINGTMNRSVAITAISIIIILLPAVLPHA